MAVLKDKDLEKPYLLDIMKVTSNNANQYDFPYYYMGQLIQTNFEYTVPKTLKALGYKNGYQHLYLEGSAITSKENSKLSWLNEGKFYTLTSITNNNDELLFTRIGANDPEFNLRRDAGFMLRRKNSKNTLFVSSIESHGSYSPVSEFAINSKSSIKELKVVLDTEQYTAVMITKVNDTSRLFITANKNPTKHRKHTLRINGTQYEWSGPYYFD